MILAAAAMSFVVVTLDDVSWAHYRAAGLPETGTVYRNAFTNVPLCGPSRATFLTGQEAGTTGIRGNNHTGNWGTNFVPQALRAAGYKTTIIGKKPNGFETSAPGFRHVSELGFTKWAVIKDVHGDRYFDVDLDVNGTVVTSPGYVTDDLYRRARNCVLGARPFFCWVAAVGAHAPADAAPRFARACDDVPFEPGPAYNEDDMSDKPSWMRGLPLVGGAAENFRAQCAALKADDEGIRSVLDLVGGDPGVCVIVTSDNGRLSGQHRLTGKSVLYEESINVPLLTWNCGGTVGNDDRLVSNVDIPATILSLSGVEPLRLLDGRPLANSNRAKVRIVGGTEIDAAGWRFRNRVEWVFDNGETEYYNLTRDPAQLENVVPPPRRSRK